MRQAHRRPAPSRLARLERTVYKRDHRTTKPHLPDGLASSEAMIQPLATLVGTEPDTFFTVWWALQLWLGKPFDTSKSTPTVCVIYADLAGVADLLS